MPPFSPSLCFLGLGHTINLSPCCLAVMVRGYVFVSELVYLLSHLQRHSYIYREMLRPSVECVSLGIVRASTRGIGLGHPLIAIPPFHLAANTSNYTLE